MHPNRTAGRSRAAILLGSACALAAAAGCSAEGDPVVDPPPTGARPAPPPPNRAPEIDGLFLVPAEPIAGQPALLTALVRDDSGEIALTGWSVEGGDVDADQFGAVWHTPEVGGAYRVAFTAQDENGASVEAVLYAAVLAPLPPPEPGDRLPVVTSLTAAPDMLNANEVTTLTVVASDPDGDMLTYTWLAPPGELIQDGGPQANYFAFEGACLPGYYALSVLVDDGRGGVSEAFTSVWIDPAPAP